jgi:hypothetical protein
LKQSKALTRVQKEIVLGHGLNPKIHRLSRVINESYIEVVNTETGYKKIIDVYKRAKNRFDY